jgi:hypothetical protein
MEVQEVSRVTFGAPVNVGTVLAGQRGRRSPYDGRARGRHGVAACPQKGRVRSKMQACSAHTKGGQGPEHSFIRWAQRDTLEQRKTLQELVFRGDTAKHVF